MSTVFWKLSRSCCAKASVDSDHRANYTPRPKVGATLHGIFLEMRARVLDEIFDVEIQQNPRGAGAHVRDARGTRVPTEVALLLSLAPFRPMATIGMLCF
jgi:hypothetical protein